MGKEKDHKVFFSDKQFYSAEVEYYIEIQLQFARHILNYNEKDSLSTSILKIIQTFNQYGEIITYDKLELKSPPIFNGVAENFFTIQRFTLEPGNYDYQLEIKELNSNYPPLIINRSIVLQTHRNEPFLSEITLTKDIHTTIPNRPTIFSKSGFDIIPMSSNYYPSQMNVLP